jgi:hypothetical protein
LTSHDLQVTKGWDESRATTLARREADSQAPLELWTDPGEDESSFAMAVAEEVQQYLHDTFEDTTWPACPTHTNHPLWLERSNGGPVWRCPTTHLGYGELGSLNAN